MVSSLLSVKLDMWDLIVKNLWRPGGASCAWIDTYVK